MKNNIIVFGGSGLVGSALKEQEPTYIYLSTKNGNLTVYEDCIKIFEKYKPTKIIFLAANVGGLYKNIDNNYSIFNDNILMELNIIRCCNKYGIKDAIFCLSTCIFPDIIEYPIKEDDLHKGEPHNSNYGYSYAKRIMDVMCNLSNNEFNSRFCCIIPTNIYGKNDNYNLVNSHVIPALIHKAYIASTKNEEFEIKGSGKSLRQFIYAGDVAEIIVNLIENENRPKRLIISPVDEISIMDVAKIVADEFSISKININTSYNDGQLKKTVDNSKLLELFPDIKFTNIKTGIKITCDWFKNNINNIRI